MPEPTKKPGPAARPSTAAAALGSSSSAEPEQPDGTGPRAAQRARQRRVAPGVGDERDHDHRGAQRHRGEQPREHAPAASGGGRPAGGRGRRPSARTPGATPHPPRPPPGPPRRRRPERPTPTSGSRRARRPGRRLSSSATGRRSPTRASGARARSGRRRRRSPRPACARPQAIAEGEQQRREDQRARRRGSSSPPWARSHSRPARAIGVPEGQPAGGSRVWTTTSARPSRPGRPADRQGRRARRHPSGSAAARRHRPGAGERAGRPRPHSRKRCGRGGRTAPGPAPISGAAGASVRRVAARRNPEYPTPHPMRSSHRTTADGVPGVRRRRSRRGRGRRRVRLRRRLPRLWPYPCCSRACSP